MDRATPLTNDQADMVIKMLRVGNTATDAAEMINVKPAAVYAAARTDTDVQLALAGHDPYAYDADKILQQAQYVGLLALGFTPTQAARILFHGDERVKGWRQNSPAFAEAAEAARRMNPPALRQRREHRFTPHRVRLFLKAVEDGMIINLAAEEAGITNAVIYQRRRRDSVFRDAMDAARARARARRAPDPTEISEEQWEALRAGVQEGMTLRRAALRADIPPQRVYDRRRADELFRRATDRWRGKIGARADSVTG